MKKNELLFLGACILRSDNNYTNFSALNDSKFLYDQIFKDETEDDIQMVLE